MSIHQEGSGNVPCFSFLFLTHTHKKKRDTENGSSDRLFYFTGQGNSFFIQWKKLNEKLRFKVDPICLQLADGVEEKTAVSQFLFDFYGTLWTRFFVCLFFFNRRTTRWTQSSSFFSRFFYEGFTDFRPISSSIGSVFRDFHTGRPLKGLVSSSFPRFFLRHFSLSITPWKRVGLVFFLLKKKGNQTISVAFCNGFFFF